MTFHEALSFEDCYLVDQYTDWKIDNYNDPFVEYAKITLEQFVGWMDRLNKVMSVLEWKEIFLDV